MAERDHLWRLDEGKDSWNRWRKENFSIRPDLRDASLRSKGFRGFDFRGADLGGTNLSDSDLRGARLEGAMLGATRLAGANLSGSKFGATCVFNVNLSNVHGLAEVDHQGLRSAIDTNTLHHTAAGLMQGSVTLPEMERFLTEARVQPYFIGFFRARLEIPPDFYSCFIAHSHHDNDFAYILKERLQAVGVQCWLDMENINLGDRILTAVGEAIRDHDKVLVCCSEPALASPSVQDEIRKALERERDEGQDIIIPLNLDGYLLHGWEDGPAADLRSRLAGDFTGWKDDSAKFETEFKRVVRALRTDAELRYV